MKAADAQSVLHGDSGDRGLGIDAERLRRFQIGLDTGAAGTVRSGDDKQARQGH